jgi:hypothetical protein
VLVVAVAPVKAVSAVVVAVLVAMVGRTRVANVDYLDIMLPPVPAAGIYKQIVTTMAKGLPAYAAHVQQAPKQDRAGLSDLGLV